MVFPSPFLCDILKKDLDDFHRSVCRVNSFCLASTPVLLLLLKSLTPALEIMLNHQALAYYYKRALGLPADNFPLQRLSFCPVLP